MADFCVQCAKAHDLPEDDFLDIQTAAHDRAGMGTMVICEGCGHCMVNSHGECIKHNDDVPPHDTTRFSKPGNPNEFPK